MDATENAPSVNPDDAQRPEHPGSAQHLEPEIRDAVQHVVNRFGVAGLESLIAHAQTELASAREALRELAE